MPAKPSRRRNDLHERMDDCEESIRNLLESHREMADNMKSLNQNLGRVADVLEALSNLKGFWLTLRLASGAARIVLPLLAIAAAVLLFLKTGQWRAVP